MTGPAAERLIGFPYRRLAEQEGIVFPDHFVYTNVGSRPQITQALASLGTGVTEIYVHPAVDTDELRASHPDWENRTLEEIAKVVRDALIASPDAAFNRWLPLRAEPATDCVAPIQ